MLASATCDNHYCTCPGYLGQHNTDRIVSIGQGKKIRRDIAGFIVCSFAPDIANVNTALDVAKEKVILAFKDLLNIFYAPL
jgi:hypothetical protein